ncbi:MAG: hypothetical protein R3B92_01495 [Patescibacteria group bacterium]
MLILGIETSCDETGVSLVADGVTEIYSSVASSADLHETTGGVVPKLLLESNWNLYCLF